MTNTEMLTQFLKWVANKGFITINFNALNSASDEIANYIETNFPEPEPTPEPEPQGEIE